MAAKHHTTPVRGWVYLIQPADDPNGPIKIGYTDTPDKRLGLIHLSAGAPKADRFRLLALLPGGRPREQELQARFNPAALGHEWFEATPNLLRFAAAHAGTTTGHRILSPDPTQRPVRPPRRHGPMPPPPKFDYDDDDERRRLRPKKKKKRDPNRDKQGRLIQPRHERKWINRDELAALLEAARNDVFDLAVISIVYNAALRASEVGRLILEYTRRLNDNKLFVERAKGSKSNWVGIHPKAARALGAWLRECYTEPEQFPDDAPVFPAGLWKGVRSDEGISRWCVNRLVTRLARQAGLPTEIAHPHSLRHGRVMHILDAAAAKPNFRPEQLVSTLAQYLGHAQATTTIQYYMSITSGVAAVNEELLDEIFGEDE